jgi:hypothetical protein
MAIVKQIQMSHSIRMTTSTGKEVWVLSTTPIKINKKGKVVAAYATPIKNKKDKWNLFPETVMSCTLDDIRKHVQTVQVEVPDEPVVVPESVETP